ISEGFIKRPIATSLLMAAIALFGMVAYRTLPVSDLPNVDFPTLLVTAQLPGANPETMGASVATPLENQFSTISGLASMTSVNSLGSTQITLEFVLDRSLDGAPDRHQRSRSGAAELERQRPDRLDHRPPSGVHAAGERPAHERRRVPEPDHLVPQQRAGAPRAARHDRRRRRGSTHGIVVLRV